MGYHRDSKHYSSISAFQGEMRRRVWHMIAQLDLLISSQFSLPSMIRGITSDTAAPHNLLDGDFDEKTAELPPSRPEAEYTPISYMICKGPICDVFGVISEQAHSTIPPSYDEVMNLDRRLHESHALVPYSLRMRPMSQSITDPPILILRRFNLELLFQKLRCILHRKYLTEDTILIFAEVLRQWRIRTSTTSLNRA